jgi:glycosyltransferase involved in cell wall biosynthesis
MKTIWIFNQYNMPPEYGHLNRHFNFGKYLNKLGYNPFVFVGSFLHNVNTQIIHDNSLSKLYDNCEFPFYFIKTNDYSKSKVKRILAMIEFYRNIFKVTKKLSTPDVILGSSAHPLAAIAAIRLAKKYGCQSIVEIRDLWPESFVAYKIFKKRNPLLKLLYLGEKWVYKNADKLIFTMEGGKDYIIEKKWDVDNGGPIDINKIYHLNNGVDLEIFDNNKHNYILDDEDLINEKSFKVIYTGSVRLVNKVEKLLDVAKILKDEDIIFLVWGEGDQLKHLKERVKNEKIANVKFKGNIEKKYIPYITSKANLNIVLGENMPLFKYGGSMNKMFDYFASGKPTLFTFKIAYSLVNRYKAGIELDNSNAENIAKNIIHFKNMDKKTYTGYCKNARNVTIDYNFEQLANSLIDIIKAK